MVPFKPYTVQVRSVTQAEGPGGIKESPEGGNWLTVKAFVQSTSAAEAYQQYGVTLDEGVIVMVETTDAGNFAPDSEVKWRDSVYRVVGRPLIYDAGNAADHAEIVCEFKQFPLS